MKHIQTNECLKVIVINNEVQKNTQSQMFSRNNDNG